MGAGGRVGIGVADGVGEAVTTGLGATRVGVGATIGFGDSLGLTVAGPVEGLVEGDPGTGTVGQATIGRADPSASRVTDTAGAHPSLAAGPGT